MNQFYHVLCVSIVLVLLMNNVYGREGARPSMRDRAEGMAEAPDAGAGGGGGDGQQSDPLAELKAVKINYVSNNLPEKPSDAAVAAYHKWLLNLGGKLGAGVEFATTPSATGAIGATGKGLTAASDIKSGSPLLTIPLAAMMTDQVAIASPIGQSLGYKPVPTLGTAMAIHLIYERHLGNESKYSKWISALPGTLNTPHYWTEDELKELTGSGLVDKIKSKLKLLKEEYDTVVKPRVDALPNLYPPQYFTYEAYQWASLIVTRHAITLPLNAKSQVFAVVPGLDFANHGNVFTSMQIDRPSNSNAVATESDKKNEVVADSTGVILMTWAPINKTQEILFNYGNKTNSELLSTYGWALSDNVLDSVDLQVSLGVEDPFAQIKVDLMKNIGLSNSNLSLLRMGLSGDLLAALRIQSMKASDLNNYKQALAGPINLENELTVSRNMLIASQNLLAGYPTSLEDDIKLLEDYKNNKNNMNERKLYSIYVRRGEREALIRTTQYVARRWESFLINGFTTANSNN